jgi:hypothetical protein
MAVQPMLKFLVSRLFKLAFVMSGFNWDDFLQHWNDELLKFDLTESIDITTDANQPLWLGFKGATESEVVEAETRLGTRFTNSYRSFLKASNGWQVTTPFIRRLWSTFEVEWFSARHQDWIDRYIDRYRRTAGLELNGYLEWPTVPDEEYFVYGDEQDCRSFRVEYLQTALEISSVGESAIYLLNPAIVNANGEWEAWFLADWLPGADRYPSFQALMEAEYENSLELWNSTFDDESYESKLTTFTVEVQKSKLESSPKTRTLIYDNAGRVRNAWPYLAINQASRWMIQNALGVHRGKKTVFQIKFQTREWRREMETRTLIYDSIGNIRLQELGIDVEKICNWIIEQINQ